MADSAPRGSRYAVLRELGAGGMGAVYLVHDRILERPAALKVVLGHASDETAERFVREARAGAALEHPALVPTYDLGLRGNELFFTMQLVEGRTLAAALGGEPPPLGTSLRWLAAAARGVAYAHQRGLVHRDLKPANIMVGEHGEVSVLDWGLVAPGTTALPEADARESSSDGRLTLDGALMGTPAYMSPEQAEGRGAQAGPSCDVYAFGAILYEILTGTPPVTAGPLREMIAQVREGRFAPPSRCALDGRVVPPALEAVCLRAMAREPSERYADAGALASDLEAWVAGRAVSVMRPPWTARALHWLADHPRAIAVGVSAAIVAIAGWAFASDLRLRERARAQERDADERKTREADLRSGLEVAASAERIEQVWAEQRRAWRDAMAQENRVLSSRQQLPPMMPKEAVPAFVGRTQQAMRDMDWDAFEVLYLGKSDIDDPTQSVLLRAHVLHLRDAWRRAAGEATDLLERACPATGPLPEDAAAGLIKLAAAGLHMDLEVALANDHDWLDPTTLRAASLTQGWRAKRAAGSESHRPADAEGLLPTELAPVWRDVVRSIRRVRAVHTRAQAHPQTAGLVAFGAQGLSRAERILDGCIDVHFEPLPPGVTGTVYRATFAPLWASERDGLLHDDDQAGLERVAPADPAGGTVVLSPGAYLLHMRREEREVRQWFLVEGDAAPRVVPLFPRRFPPDVVLVPQSDVPIRGEIGSGVPIQPVRSRAGPFFVARTAVTLDQYRAFLDALGPGELYSEMIPKLERQPQLVRDPHGTWQLAPGLTDHRAGEHPALEIAYCAAAMYCRWRSQQDGWAWRLPTLAEWSLAAGGPAGLRFPWGDTPDPRRVPCREGNPRAVPADGYPAGRSPYGAFLLTGSHVYLATPQDSRFVLNAGGECTGSIVGNTVLGIGRSTTTTDQYLLGIRLVCEPRD